MAKPKLKSFDEAQEAQQAGKESVRNAKQALTDYLKENKLKRNVDYTDDKKHGKKVTSLTNAVEKASSALESINEQMKALKPSKERVSKYDYPEGLTPEEKKKFRQAARSSANKDSKPKKEKVKKEKAEKKGKAKSKPAAEAPATKKAKKKKAKKSND